MSLGIIGVFHVAVGWIGGQIFTGFAFLLHGCLDLLAAVLYIELIEQRLFRKGKDKQAEIQYSCGFAAGWLPKS